MGLHVTSVAEIARKSEGVKGINYYVYFLNYYQFSDEVVEAFVSEIPAMESHFSELGNALLITSLRNFHFAGDVLSWHNIVGLDADAVCPCLLICTMPPSAFIDVNGTAKKMAFKKDQVPWFILELGKLCSNATELRALVKKVVEAFSRGATLDEFREAEVFNFRKRPIVHGNPTYMGVSLNLGALKDRVSQAVTSRRAKRPNYRELLKDEREGS
jgi:hypothetical protein